MARAGFRLVSDAFAEGEPIPREYGREGEDRSPPLRWSRVPEGTRSFVLQVVDPDAPGCSFTHWLLYDIPADRSALEAGAKGVGTPGRNDFEHLGWGGPLPPAGAGEHRYFFTLSALDLATLDLPEGARREEVERAIEGHVIGEAELMGRCYRRD